MRKRTIVTLAFVCGSAIGTSAFAGSGTVTAVLSDARPCGFVQFSDAPTTWYSVSSAIGWQVIVGAATTGDHVTYTPDQSFNTCGGVQSLASVVLGNPH